MKFGAVATSQAKGAMLAHALKLASGRKIAKGTLLDTVLTGQIEAAGIASVIVARLDAGDVSEDAAAKAIAGAMASKTIGLAAAATGRVNLHARVNGLFTVDRDKVDAINAVDPGITFATLKPLAAVEAGRMVATVKIIPYALASSAVVAAVKTAVGAIGIDEYCAKRIGVVATRLAVLKPGVMDKTIRFLQARLEPSSSQIAGELRSGHSEGEVARAITALLPDVDIVLVFSASAICDIDDVIPSAIRKAGGRIEHFGMPVDPGNLLLLGEVDGKPVIGAPGCARSPAENGFDWILQRLLAGRKVTSSEIAGLGVGGLLMEIGNRPQPREMPARQMPRVCALILAAGRSTRMGEANKLLANLHGKPLLAHVLEAACASKATQTFVVTGHEHRQIMPLVEAAGAKAMHNEAYREGLSASLAAGISGLGPQCDAALVMLGDMPLTTSHQIDLMVDSFAAAPTGSIVVATHNGVRGNPVIWPRKHFAALLQIKGDTGARQLIGEHAGAVVSVELGEAASLDIDTPQALATANERQDSDSKSIAGP